MTSVKLFDTLSDGLPSMTDPKDTERVRDFITHLSVMSTQSFYNSVVALVQDPHATTPLPRYAWERLGRKVIDNAPAIGLNFVGGPIGLAYDVRHTFHPSQDTFEGLPSQRYELSQGKALGMLHSRMKREGLEIERRRLSYKRRADAIASAAEEAPIELTGDTTLQLQPSRSPQFPVMYVLPTRSIDSTLPLPTQQRKELSQIIFGISWVTTTYQVPWLQHFQHSEKKLAQHMKEAAQRSHDLRECKGDSLSRKFEASLATLILGGRFGWDLDATLAKEFLKEDYPAPAGSDLIAALRAVHFIESVLNPRLSRRLRYVYDITG